MKRRLQQGVALVITLIFLAVITLLAVAFLALSGRGRVATRESTNRTVAEQMAEIGLERAKGEILARIISTNTPDLLGPGLLVSQAYLTNQWFGDPKDGDRDPEDLSAITNLFEDPWVPVFINTNVPGVAGPLDFRFYLDLNRNGLFETNGDVAVVDAAGQPLRDTGGNIVIERSVGDPEWLGVLNDSNEPHGRDNLFLGRFAFLTMPAGRTLDINYVHNDAKRSGAAGFFRNQGVGPWEINLAAFLTDLNTNQWRFYQYNTNLGLASLGLGFADASDLLHHRYHGTFVVLRSLAQMFPVLAVDFTDDYMDGYSDSAASLPEAGFPVDNDDPLRPWPGAPNATNFFTPNDFFDNQKLPDYRRFITKLNRASTSPSSYDRYTFYRLLSQLGTDSAPEQEERTHLNFINYGTNAAEQWISLTNFVAWTNEPAALSVFGMKGSELFFNTVAERFLREEYNFGVTNIPIFTNNSARFILGPTNTPLYHPRVHQLMQLTANLYTAGYGSRRGENYPFLPTVFRPRFRRAGNDIYISHYEELNSADFYSRLLRGELRWWNLRDPTNRPPDTGSVLIDEREFFYEIPLIVGAKNGFPNFNEFALQSDVQLSRKLELRKSAQNAGPTETNQMFLMGISNVMGVEAWHPYTNRTGGSFYFPRRLELWTAVSTTTTLTNDDGFVGTDTRASNAFLAFNPDTWGGGLTGSAAGTNQFRIPLLTAQIILTNGVYYRLPFPHFENVAPSNRFERGLGTYTNRWFMTVSNRLLYFLFDRDVPGGPHLVDAVTMNGLDTAFDISAELNKQSGSANPIDNAWDNRAYGNVTRGVWNQVGVGLGLADSSADWSSYGAGNLAAGQDKLKAIDAFRYFVDPTQTRLPLLYFRTNDLPPLGLVHQSPFAPTKRVIQATSWQVNDPLVHSTAEDLHDGVPDTQLRSPPRFATPVSLLNDFNLNKVNLRYRPWGGASGGASGTTGGNDYNPKIKDPGIWGPDQWDFPDRKYPNIGWLGRVHRGTPWQTIYLKSEAAGPQEWLGGNRHGTDWATHPTNDWRLVDLFTTALHPGMTRGRLSINQTNLAAWSAVLSGVPVTTWATDATGDSLLVQTNAQPAALDPAVALIVEGIARRRENMPGRQFTRLADILSVPELTFLSPYLAGAAASAPERLLTDSDLERIPQQILSLLKVGEPRFVVYAFGQSLIPAEVYTGRDGTFGVPINYRVTGEMAARAVVRVDFDRLSDDPADPGYRQRDYSRPHLVVEQYNILPAF